MCLQTCGGFRCPDGFGPSSIRGDRLTIICPFSRWIVDSSRPTPYHPHMPSPVRIVEYQAKREPVTNRGDDLAYLAPMLVFLVITWLGTNGTFKKYVPFPYPVSYFAKTVIVAALLVFFWRRYTKIRWNHWWL